jgi:(3,5-dihydroxyphenyl)acetyl-CoA 1,2-dioxygenase
MRTAAATVRLEGSRPALSGRLTSDAKHAFAYFEAGRAALEGLSAREARMEVHDALRPVRSDFMARHAEAVYAELTAGFRDEIRVEELVFEAAERFPGLVPTREAIAAERRLPQAEKEGLEVDQGVFLARLLASPRAGLHLVHTMLRPRRKALDRLEEFRATGSADLGLAHLERRGRIGHLELRNPRFLNAEDDGATAALEIGVDLVLLDPQIDVGVLRGGTVDHPRYAGRRVFNAGINLTHLYHGQISFVNFMIARELGLLGKIYRGHWTGGDFEAGLEETSEKPWMAAVESFAIGGGCQLLLVMDRVIAERGSYFNLPARKEGIVPGNANWRLPRLVGERAARQAIMFERAFQADSAEGALLCDRLVEDSEAMDVAIEEDAAQLTSSGAVSVAANRKAMRVGLEPVDAFRRYMAVYAREQSLCMHSPALIRNLETNWNAKQRRL